MIYHDKRYVNEGGFLYPTLTAPSNLIEATNNSTERKIYLIQYSD